MRGVKEEVLVAIVDFLYRGEAKHFQDFFYSFHAVAEDFRLDGLKATQVKTKNCHISLTLQ